MMLWQACGACRDSDTGGHSDSRATVPSLSRCGGPAGRAREAPPAAPGRTTRTVEGASELDSAGGTDGGAAGSGLGPGTVSGLSAGQGPGSDSEARAPRPRSHRVTVTVKRLQGCRARRAEHRHSGCSGLPGGLGVGDPGDGSLPVYKFKFAQNYLVVKTTANGLVAIRFSFASRCGWHRRGRSRKITLHIQNVWC